MSKSNKLSNRGRVAVFVLALSFLFAPLLACKNGNGNNGQSCIGQATTCAYELVKGQ